MPGLDAARHVSFLFFSFCCSGSSSSGGSRVFITSTAAKLWEVTDSSKRRRLKGLHKDLGSESLLMEDQRVVGCTLITCLFSVRWRRISWCGLWVPEGRFSPCLEGGQSRRTILCGLPWWVALSGSASRVPDHPLTFYRPQFWPPLSLDETQSSFFPSRLLTRIEVQRGWRFIRGWHCWWQGDLEGK